MRVAMMTAAAILCVSCIEQGRQGEAIETDAVGADADTAGTGDAKDAGDASGAGDVSDARDVPDGADAGCAPGSCDDHDPCTYDYCDAVTGACVYQPWEAPEVVGCVNDGDCDEVECEVAHCATATTCGATVGTCVYEPIPACGGGCDPAACDEGAPCKRYGCAEDGQCTSTEIPDCDPGCTAEGVVDIAALATIGDEDEDAVRVSGVAVPAEPPDCATSADPCRCEHPLGLDDATATATLVPGDDAPDANAKWGCATATCGADAVTCAPLLEGGTVYWVWGATVESGDEGDEGDEGGGDGAPARLPAGAIEVDGFCVATTPSGLAGTYRGTLVVADGGSAVAQLEIAHTTQGGWSIALVLSACGPCPSGDARLDARAIDVGDGRLSFVVDAPVGQGAVPVRVTLFSSGNHLAGSYVSQAASSGDGLSGSLRVTKRRAR